MFFSDISMFSVFSRRFNQYVHEPLSVNISIENGICNGSETSRKHRIHADISEKNTMKIVKLYLNRLIVFEILFIKWRRSGPWKSRKQTNNFRVKHCGCLKMFLRSKTTKLTGLTTTEFYSTRISTI